MYRLHIRVHRPFLIRFGGAGKRDIDIYTSPTNSNELITCRLTVDKILNATIRKRTDRSFGAGAIGSAADARLISISDAAVLLGQLQHGPGHLLTLALLAFQETGDIGEQPV
jgi:hypothetical protein